MAIVPDGLPAWTRTAAITYYGGHLNKANLLGQGAVNPKTDVTAAQITRLSADLASLVRVAPLAVMNITCNDTSPAAPTVNWVTMMSAVDVDGYAGDSPPTGFPTLARVSNGVFTVTFGATLADDYGVTANVDLIGGIGSVSSGASADVDIAASDPNADTYSERATVKVFDNGGAVSNATVTIELYT